MLRQEVAVDLAPAVAAPGRSFAAVAGAYLSLTKPRIIVLLLVTTVPAMILAEGGMPSPWLMFLTLLGGSLSAAGANTINCYVDRDIDRLMARTRGRPLASGVIEPESALFFGATLGIVAFALLTAGVNEVAALLSLAALGFYVTVYTLWLKRSSPQNIVIGGAAGAMPPVIGWAAVTGGLGWPALALFAIIFLWTPPHFWALALRYREDYARAGVPMLPVVRGERETHRQILLYSVVLAAASLVLAPVAGMGPLYLIAALALGAGFVAVAARLWRTPSARASRAVFLYSIAYLALLFVAIGIDGFL